jgi:endonuclease/exonuclease/phosphatase family metal-dependent hydrolase
MSAAARHGTFPVDAPREQLDHILLDGQLGAVSSSAPRLALSDHRALVAELEA